jgi:glycosyltransferase involved in cell wall biosynthesis
MAKLPVVTTNVGSVPEVVLDNVTGLITGLEVQEIADAIEKLVRDKALRAQLGIAAQGFTLANFGVQRLVHDHEVLYKKLLSSPTKF